MIGISDFVSYCFRRPFYLFGILLFLLAQFNFICKSLLIALKTLLSLFKIQNDFHFNFKQTKPRETMQ